MLGYRKWLIMPVVGMPADWAPVVEAVFVTRVPVSARIGGPVNGIGAVSQPDTTRFPLRLIRFASIRR